MKLTDLQLMLKIGISVLLMLVPIHMLSAQAETATEQKKLRVKMIKSINGEVQIIDTVVNMADYADRLSSIKGLKIDTAVLRKMQTNLRELYTTDSISGIRFKQNGKWTKPDSVIMKRLAKQGVSIYRSGKVDDSIKTVKLYQRFEVAGKDIIHFKRDFKTDDSTFRKRIYRLKGDTILFDAMKRSKGFKISLDSINIFKLIDNGKWEHNFKPALIDKIIVQSEANSKFKVDSLTGQGIKRMRILVDSVSDDGHVYVIRNNGEMKQLSPEKWNIDRSERIIYLMLKTEVKDLSDNDKKVLKSEGNKVETGRKETLKLHDLDFYPNPNNGRFNLRFSVDQKGDAVIRMLNMKGKEIYKETVKDLTGEYKGQIDVSGIGKGIYFLLVMQGKQYATRKILIE